MREMNRWQEHRPEADPQGRSWAVEEEDVPGRNRKHEDLDRLINKWKWEGALEWNF